jgi:uncharacterized repeat protein (TIGR02543 family)
VETTIAGDPLDQALAIAEGAVVYKDDEMPVGQYLFSFVLKDAAGKTILVVSDIVVVTSGAKSAKEYALTDTDFNGPPAAPSAFTVASYNVENQTLQFTWQDNSFNETGFTLSDGTTPHAIAAATQSFDFPVADPTASVVYTLKAVNSFGESTPAHISGPIVFTITFDVDNGDVEAQALQANPGASFGANMPANPTRTNYAFGGWYTAKNGGGSAFTADTAVIRNLTVYAKWINVYTVTFDADGGSPAIQTRTVIDGGTLGTNTPSAPTRAGYTFEGWYTAKNGGGSVLTADTMITSGLTVYAKWTVTQYTVTFDADGGSPATQTRTVIHGASLGVNIPAAPTRAGYTFEGWYTAINGGGGAFTADTIITSNLTVYAKWIEGVRYELTKDTASSNYICNANDLLPSGFTVAMGEQITVSFAIKTDTAMMGFYVGIGDWNNSAYYADGEDGWIASGWRSTTSVAADGQFHVYTWTLTAHADAPVGGEPLVFRFVMKSVSKEKVVAYVKDVSVTKSPSVFSNLSLAESLAWITENAEEGGDYIIILKKSESIAPQTLSYSDKNVNITLNGSTVERIVSLSANGSLFTIDNGVTLTLRNNVTLRGLSSNTASLVWVNSGGNLVLKDGAKISGNSADFGGGVYVSDGTFTQSGGTISGNSSGTGGGVYIRASGAFTMNGGEISGNSTSYGGGVYVRDSGTFLINAGNISNNSANYGGGVYIESNSTFTMSGGTVNGNTATLSKGGGVFLAGGTFTMSGGAISGNSISGNESGNNYGGGMYVYGTFTMNGGEISGNSAVHGGGVYVYDNGTFTMSNGTISGNTANTGGGVYVRDSGTFTMNGGAISGNSISGNGGGVYVINNSTFFMNAGNISNNSAKYGGGVYIEGNSTFTMSGGTVNGNTAILSHGGGVFLAVGTFTMSGGEISGNSISGNDDYGNNYGGGVYVDSGAFTLNGGTISGNSASNGGGVVVYKGTFTMSNGTMSGNTASGSGGGVAVYGGVFTMSGGTVNSNTSTDYGGGVVVSSGTFTMNGGEINGNSATHGGGVIVDSEGTFTMRSGAIISGNTAATHGGGVFVYGTFTMSDGTISGNSTSGKDDAGNSFGGGVFLAVGTFTMSGGTINGNSVVHGGGVFVDSSGTFTMSSGAISGNTATGIGGGVFVYGTFTKQSGGIIYGSNADASLKNTATSGNGHAVYVSSGSKKRNSTAGVGVTLNSGTSGGWE